MGIAQLLQHYAAALVEPAHGQTVFANAEKFIAQNSLLKRVWLRAKRDLVMLFTFQSFLVREKVPNRAKRILYVYLGTPNLGDSIMDLSPRVLWKCKNLIVDCYTNETIAGFYKDDNSFSRIITRSEELASDYDFIVLQSYSWRCLKFKWRYFLFRPFSTLYGHYYGSEFNRLEFAEAAWRHILHIPKRGPSDKCPVVFNLSLDHAASAMSERNHQQVALAVGGIVDWRTYSNWVEVIALVHKKIPNLEWLLLGSDNGLQTASELIQLQNVKVKNLVSKLSLNEVFKQLQQVGLLVAADGGLMNIGRSAGVPMVALFAREIHPRMRFAEEDSADVLYAPEDVSQISAHSVATAILAAIDSPLKELKCPNEIDTHFLSKKDGK